MQVVFQEQDPIAKELNLDIAIVDKRRDKANESEAMNVIGNVKESNV